MNIDKLEKKKQILSVLVLSFDGYKDIWPYFEFTFNKYWSDCPYGVYLTTNFEGPNLVGINILKTSREINWTTRVKKAIQVVDSEYIFILLEDYLLAETVDNSHILMLEKFVKEEKPNYLRLVNIPKKRFKTGNSKIQKLYEDEEYGVNLQVSIWKKDYLLDVLKEVDGSAWDFEIYFLKKAINSKHIPMESNYASISNIFNIYNGVLKGKWMPKTVKYFKKQGLFINVDPRGSLTKKEEYSYLIKAYLRDVLPYSIRKSLKKVFLKFKFKFTTKF